MKTEEILSLVNQKEFKGYDHKYKIFIDMLKDKISFGYARFNDGEMMGIERVGSVVARGDQKVNKELSLKLKDALIYEQMNYWKGIPCSLCFPSHYKLAKSLIDDDYEYITSAVALTNRNWANFISEIPQAIKDRKVIWISGMDQKVENLPFKVDVVHKYKSKNSWDEYRNIVNLYDSFEPDDVVFISLGPTARVLVKDWFSVRPWSTFIDIGSVFDPFTRNVWHRCHTGWEKGFNDQKKCKECN